MAPVREHRFLHPAQIMGVVDVSHEVDDVGTDLDVVIVGQCGWVHIVDTNVSKLWQKDESSSPAAIRRDALIGKPQPFGRRPRLPRSEEHTSELQSLMRISYAVFCLKKKQNTTNKHNCTHDFKEYD